MQTTTIEMPKSVQMIDLVDLAEKNSCYLLTTKTGFKLKPKKTEAQRVIKALKTTGYIPQFLQAQAS
jgi:hypothetical protein